MYDLRQTQNDLLDNTKRVRLSGSVIVQLSILETEAEEYHGDPHTIKLDILFFS